MNQPNQPQYPMQPPMPQMPAPGRQAAHSPPQEVKQSPQTYGANHFPYAPPQGQLSPQPAAYSGPTLCQGETCLFFKKGSRNGSEAYTAIVLAEQGGGMLDLQVLRKGEPMFPDGVRHVDDPIFEERPDLRAKLGAWDFKKSDQSKR